MAEPKLFMTLLGCRPPGRNTEQHDVFFGIAESVKELVPQIRKFWPGAGAIHVDAWREVTNVGGYQIQVVPRQEKKAGEEAYTLYFLNLGGYRAGEFDEFHYKLLVVAKTKNEAIQQAKTTTFYKHTGFKGAPSHIDDKFGVDVDDLHEVKDILSEELKARFSIQIEQGGTITEDKLHLGYFPFNKL
ncbi:DUF1543 domain-containing protein [Pontibacter sp. KCTC 32443]|uniref:DUF1543 domain-containing protein n=1 Tax=Pontibacter TaxID=323449 RepID=UPI00164E691C|nr:MULTISPECIES: DUF1543 domain-containing protein [Pontibacter]MBC5774701.1 DUF1543 domain-containing protein [Pontibacter sp. KCTC 32443]